MEVDEIELQVVVEKEWRRFSGFCGLDTLFALRRTTRAFHKLVGTSFTPLERTSMFPTPDHGMDDILKGFKAIESLRSSRESFPSVSALDWSSWCVQPSLPVGHALEHANATTLHLSSAHPMAKNELDCFSKVTTISADFLLAFARLEADAYPGITSIAILPLKEHLFDALLPKVLQHNDLKVNPAVEEDGQPILQALDRTSIRAHFYHLLMNGFFSLTSFSMVCNEWDEVQATLSTFIERETIGNDIFSHLTKLVLYRADIPQSTASNQHNGSTSATITANGSAGFKIPADVSLIPSLLKSLPHLEDLWIDHSISTWVDVETLELKNLKRLHATIAGDPPVCLTLSGPNLEYFRLQVHDGSVVTVDPITTQKLEKIEISASLQAISFLLSSLEGDPHAFPHLHTIEFSASMSETTTMPVFELVDLPNLNRLHARFSLTPASGLSPPGPVQSPLPVAMLRTPSIVNPAVSNAAVAQLHQHHAHEANSVPLALSITINSSRLRYLALDLRPGIIVQRLMISPSLTQLSSLLVASHPSPRASSVMVVELPYLPPSITTMHIPAQWILRTAPIAVPVPPDVNLDDVGMQSPVAANTNQTMDATSLSASGAVAYVTLPVKFDSIAAKLSLASFGVPEPVSSLLDFHPRLSVLSLQLHVPDSQFLPRFSLILPQLVNLRECLLRLMSVDSAPTLQQPLPCTHLSSNSLQMLNLKLLPQVYAKPTPQGTVGSTLRIAPHCASAVDPHLVLPNPNNNFSESIGRAECAAANCRCTGYTRDAKNSFHVCATLSCGHPATSHRLTPDSNAKWLTLRLKCPKLTHLALAGLSEQNDISSLIRGSPLLTHAQISFAATPDNVTITHSQLVTLHIARLESAKTIYLNLPKLVRLYVESCPQIQALWPYPTPKLETVSLVATLSISPDSRLALQRCNVQGPAFISTSAPSKYYFPDYIPSL